MNKYLRRKIMEPKTVYDLSDICESVFTGRPLTEAEDDENKKKDEDDTSSDSPFADTDNGDTEDSENTEDTKDTEDTDPSDDGSPFGGDTDDTASTEPDENDTDGDDSDAGFAVDDNDTEDDGQVVEGSTEYDEIGQLGIEILMLSSQVHFWHINCRKGSQHEALNALYYKLNDGGDRLLEAVISKTNQSVVASGELSFDFGNLEFDKDESVGILEDVRDHVNEVAGMFSDDQTFANVLGDISEDLSSAIYKLSRFDSEIDNG